MDGAKLAEREHFAYFVEPSRRVTTTAIIAMISAVVLALLVPILLAFAVGPGLWLLLEWLRRGRGIWLEGDHLLIEHPYIRRARRVDYVDIYGHAMTATGRLALACRKARPGPPDSASGKPVALTQMRPAEGKLHPGLVITSRLGDPASLKEELAARLADNSASVEAIPPQVVLGWVARRRLRNLVIGAIVFFATPLWVLILLQIIDSLLRIGGNSFGR